MRTAAFALLTARGCQLGHVGYQYSARVRAGHVISQIPRAGVHLAFGLAVKLTVSKGRHS